MRSIIETGRRPFVLVAVLLAALVTPIEPISAQGNRDQRPGRGGRRNGGPDRPNREGRRDSGDRPERANRENDRPAASTAAPATTPAANSFGTVSDSDRIRKWASDTVAKHDKNGDKILEGEELGSLGQSGRNADQNSDGKITVDELYQFSASKAAPSTATAPASTSATSSNPKDTPETDPLKRKIVNDKRKSYRFKSTKDRTNNWRFSSRDADGDGQVSMSEYTRSWSNRTAAEFLRYDKDNDGMITAEEGK